MEADLARQIANARLAYCRQVMERQAVTQGQVLKRLYRAAGILHEPTEAFLARELALAVAGLLELLEAEAMGPGHGEQWGEGLTKVITAALNMEILLTDLYGQGAVAPGAVRAEVKGDGRGKDEDRGD